MRKLLLGFTLTLLCNISYGCYTGPADLNKLNGQPIIRLLSENAKYLLEMHPAKWSEKNKERWSPKNEKFTVIKESLGIIYSVAEDGLMTPAWEVEGIYPNRYISGMFPYFPEEFTFYVSNDGNKVVGITKKREETKELISIYDRSGIVTKLTRVDFKASLVMVFGCGGGSIISFTHLRADDVLELTARVRGNRENPIVYKKWKMSVHTGKLIKSPN